MRETGQVNVPTGSVVLKFAIEEIESFAEMIDDIVTVLNSNTRVDVHVCQSCGTEIEEIIYEEPEGEELA